MLVLGVGNRWRGDDAAGLEVARRAGGIEHEGDATRLLDAWAGAGEVVVVDAAVSGAPPGTLRWFDPRGAPLPATELRSSTHAFGVADAIELARALGGPPGPPAGLRDRGRRLLAGRPDDRRGGPPRGRRAGRRAAGRPPPGASPTGRARRPRARGRARPPGSGSPSRR